MRRPLVLASIATFAVVDVLLVALAVTRVNPTDAAGSPLSPAGQRPAPGQPHAQAQSQLGVDDETPAPGIAPSARPVHLDVGADGTLLRATRGDCKGQRAEIALSLDQGSSFRTVSSPVVEVLRVKVVSASNIWMVGLDKSCAAGFYRSADAGRSWSASAGTSGAWHVLSSPAKAVHAPGGRSDVGCQPTALAPVGFDRAYVACADGTLRGTRDAGQSWRPAGEVKGALGLAFRSPSTGFAVASHSGCDAQVWSTSDAGRSWHQTACLPPGRAARGIAVSEREVYVQQGDQIVRGDREGGGFGTVG